MASFATRPQPHPASPLGTCASLPSLVCLARLRSACTLYFVSFALAKAALFESGRLARTPALLLSGAFAGAMSWVPVYPIDVVKTQIQVELGDGATSTENSFMGTTRRLWQMGGPMAFWDGIGPKLARAVVNHAVTFLVVDFVCGLWLARRLL